MKPRPIIPGSIFQILWPLKKFYFIQAPASIIFPYPSFFFRSHDENDESSYHRPASRERNGDQIHENIAPGTIFVLTQKSHYPLIAVGTEVNQLRDCIGEAARDNYY
jgi:hypothetical protein